MSKKVSYWTPEEVEALRDAVAKHGAGKWKIILMDPERPNSKTDKWKAMKVSQVKGVKMTDDFMTPKDKATSSSAVAPKEDQNNSSTFGSTVEANFDILDYETMIFEALAFPENPRGSNISMIAGFIKHHHEVPENFTKLLDQELMRLVKENKVDKGQRFNRINDAALDTESAAKISACWIDEANSTVDKFTGESSEMGENADAMATLSEEFIEYCSWLDCILCE